ncbi:MAG: hypothetical protein KR126chlam1_00323 [Chlamydiae bacterium]|nr:hypothetical protein [Chlamydiota bacterium]
MSKPLIIRKRAKIVALVLFLIGLGILTYTGVWWPGLMLVVGIPLALMQYLQGRHYDTWISLFVFVGAFLTVQFEIQWEILLPVLFSIGGLYIFIREWLESRSAKEQEEDAKKRETENNKD